jgi:hypothetical protein
MAAESDKLITWDEALHSNIEPAPGLDKLTMQSPPPVKPDPPATTRSPSRGSRPRFEQIRKRLPVGQAFQPSGRAMIDMPKRSASATTSG